MPNANTPTIRTSANFALPPGAPALTGAVTKKHIVVPNLAELLAWAVRAQRLKLITIKEVCERTGMGASFVHAEAAAGRFPKPVKLGASKSRRAASRFVDSEISDWIERRIAERDTTCSTPPGAAP